MRSSAGQLEEFKKSFIWLDMLDELDVWLEQIHNMMENADDTLSSRKLDKLAGNCESIRNFGNLLDILINEALIEREKGGKDG